MGGGASVHGNSIRHFRECLDDNQRSHLTAQDKPSQAKPRQAKASQGKPRQAKAMKERKKEGRKEGRKEGKKVESKKDIYMNRINEFQLVTLKH